METFSCIFLRFNMTLLLFYNVTRINFKMPSAISRSRPTSKDFSWVIGKITAGVQRPAIVQRFAVAGRTKARANRTRPAVERQTG